MVYLLTILILYSQKQLTQSWKLESLKIESLGQAFTFLSRVSLVEFLKFIVFDSGTHSTDDKYKFRIDIRLILGIISILFTLKMAICWHCIHFAFIILFNHHALFLRTYKLPLKMRSVKLWMMQSWLYSTVCQCIPYLQLHCWLLPLLWSMRTMIKSESLPPLVPKSNQ